MAPQPTPHARIDSLAREVRGLSRPHLAAHAPRILQELLDALAEFTAPRAPAPRKGRAAGRG